MRLMLRRTPSLTLRLTALFAAVAVLVFAAVGLYLYQVLAMQMARSEDAELIEKVAQVRRILAGTASTASIATKPGPLLAAMSDTGGLVLRIRAASGATLLLSSPPSQPLPAARVVPAERRATTDDVQDWRTDMNNGRMVSAGAAVGQAGPSAADRVQLTIGRVRRNRSEVLHRYALDLALAICVGAALMAGFGFLVVRHGLAPLRAIITKANAISTHRLNERLAVEQAPLELRELGDAFNAMLERLEEGVQRLSGFAADLAHDLRTPINTLMMETQVALARARSIEDYQTLLANNSEEYERLAHMIENTLFLARVDNARLALRCVTLDPQRELERVRSYFDGLAEDAGIKLHVTPTAAAPALQADPILLRRALNNLVSNAISHTPPQGVIGMTVRHDDAHLVLEICNSGSRIEADHLPHIFERYYRADAARGAATHSAGLGLAIVRAIMLLHHGRAEADSPPDGLTTFSLHFPLLPA